MGHFDNLLNALRESILPLSSPQSTFEISNDGCEDGFIKIIAYESPGGSSTGVLNCDEVTALIEFANEIAPQLEG